VATIATTAEYVSGSEVFELELDELEELVGVGAEVVEATLDGDVVVELADAEVVEESGITESEPE
jgi:hypothetical protein